MLLFLALMSAATAIGGACAFAIFWPLALVHLRERHPVLKSALGSAAFLRPSALWWLLRGGYRATPDPQLSGLATPARVSLWLAALGTLLALAFDWAGKGGWT